jgi:hypothetical protein
MTVQQAIDVPAGSPPGAVVFGGDCEQRISALARANEVRLGIAALRRELRVGALAPAAAVTDGRAAGMTCGDLIVSFPRFGAFRMRRLLGGLRIGERRRVGDLTDRQRGLLVDAVAAAVAKSTATPATCGAKRESLEPLSRYFPTRATATGGGER